MANAYGYIRGTESVDGDPIDVFLHTDMDEWNGGKVYVVDQTRPDGSFDEHKVMLGFNDKDAAMSAYVANYDATWVQTHPGLRITETNLEDFNKWIQSSHRKTKPFADYSNLSKVTYNVQTEQSATAITGNGYMVESKPVEPQQPKPKKRKWISDEDAAEFDDLCNNLRTHLGVDDDIVQEDATSYGHKKSPSKIRQDLTTRSGELLAPSSTGGANLQKIHDNLRKIFRSNH